MVDDSGSGAGAMITFELSAGTGATLKVGKGGLGGRNLMPGKVYFVRMYDYKLADNTLSAVSAELLAWTRPAAPSYTAETASSTANSFVLVSGSVIVSDLYRRFFIHTTQMKKLTPGNVVDAGVLHPGVQSFSLLGDGTSGSEVKVGSEVGISLAENQKYYVRAYDYRGTGVASPISGAVSARTAPALPDGYDSHVAAARSVTFNSASGTRAKPATVERRYYASTGKISEFLSDGAGQAMTEDAVVSGDGTSVRFTGLSPMTSYYFYFIDHHGGSGLRSAHLERGPISTLEEAPTLPTGAAGEYAEDKDEATTTTIKFKDGPVFTERSVSRQFFYRAGMSLGDVSGAVLAHDASQANSPIKTFTMMRPATAAEAQAFVLGAAGFRDSDDTSGLSANTRYYVKYRDTRGSNLHSELSPEFSGWTVPATPAVPTFSEAQGTSLKFEYSPAGTVPARTERYFYASTSTLDATKLAKAAPFDTGTERVASLGLSGLPALGKLKGTLASAGSVSEVVTPGLAADTQYHVYVMDYNFSSKIRGAGVKVGSFYTSPAASAVPVLTQDKSKTTHETLSFTDEVALASDFTRKYFIANQDLQGLGILLDGLMHDGADFGAFSATATTRAANSAVHIGADPGSGSTELSFSEPSAFSLEANTQYWLRAYDYRTDQSAAKTALSVNQSFWTAPAAPSGYSVTGILATSVAFSGGSDVPAGVSRRFYASTSDIDMLTAGQAVDGKGFSLTEASADNTAGTTALSVSDVTFDGLREGIKYYFYFVDYNPVSGFYAVLKKTAMPRSDAVLSPEYSVGSGVAERTIPLVKSGGTAAASERLVRRFFVNAGRALRLTEAERDGVGVPGGVTTFTVRAPGAIVLGSNTPVENVSLTPNTKYFVYVADYNVVTGQVSEAYDITGDSGTWTKPLVPKGYRVSGITENTVTFSRGGAVPQNIVRRYFRSTSAGLVFSNGVPADAQGTFTKLTGVTDPVSVTFTGLATGTRHYFYFVDHNAESGFSAVLKLEATPEQGAVIPPAYSVSDGLSATTIPLHQVTTVNASAMLVRRFFVNAGNALSLSETQRDGSSLLDGVTTFTVNAPGAVVLGSKTPVENVSLTPNTKYFVYATDYDTRTQKVSKAHKVTGDDGVWTLPLGVNITVPTVSHNAATTGDVSVAGNTKIHWVLLKEGSVLTSGLTGVGIKNAVKNTNIVDARRVINKGTLSSGSSQTIALHTGAVGFVPNASYVLYYVVEGAISDDAATTFADFDTDMADVQSVKGVSFTVPPSSAGPDVPALSQKQGSLTTTGQVYTARFTSGTLYYLLRQGEKNDDVSAADVKSGTEVVGENKGTVAANASPKEVVLRGLSAGTQYTLYAMLEASGGQQSAVATKTFTTKQVPGPVVIQPPRYVSGVATESTLPLMEGSVFSGVADRRRFFVSKSDLSTLVVSDVKTGTSSGVEGEVWTFVLEADITEVTIGSGTPEANKRLEPNTNYFVRALDYAHATGRKSDLSDDLGGTTAKSALPGPPFGMLKPVVYAYPNPTSGLLHVPVSEGVAVVYGSDGTEVGSFEVSAGQIDLTGLAVGNYVVCLNDTHWVRVVKR